MARITCNVVTLPKIGKRWDKNRVSFPNALFGFRISLLDGGNLEDGKGRRHDRLCTMVQDCTGGCFCVRMITSSSIPCASSQRASWPILTTRFKFSASFAISPYLASQVWTWTLQAVACCCSRLLSPLGGSAKAL